MTNDKKSLKNDILMLKHVYIFKRIIPTSTISLSILILLKFIGIFIFFNNISQINGNVIVNILRIICIFQDFSKPHINSNYEFLCFLIYLVTLIPLLLFFFSYMKDNKLRNNVFQKKINKKLKRILKIAGVFYYLVLIFFQHFIEILTHIFFSYIVYNNPRSKNIIITPDNIISFINGLSLPYQFYMTMNFIIYLIVNIYLFLSFFILNEPYFKSNGNFNMKLSKFSVIFLLIVFNLQGFHYLDLIFASNIMFTVKLTVYSLFIFFYLIFLLEYIICFNFPYFTNNLILWFLSNFFFSALLELGLFLFTSNLNSSFKAIIKLVIENFLTLCLMYTVNFIKHRRFIVNLENNLIVNSKGLNIEAMFYLVYLMKACLKDYKKLYDIYKLFNTHRLNCSEQSRCLCSTLDMDKFKVFINIMHKTEEYNSSEKIMKFNLYFQEFMNLFEMTIINLTDLNQNNDSNYLSLLLLHIDFIYFFKNSQLFSNFITGKYLLMSDKIPLNMKFYLYCYKVNIMKESKKNIKNNNGYLIFYHLMKYIHNFQKIDFLMLNYSELVEKLIKIRGVYNAHKDNIEDETIEKSKLSLIEDKESFRIDEVIKICGKMKKCFIKLKDKLKKNFKKEICRNVEMSYKLNNFFLLFNKKVPVGLKYYFLQIEEGESLIKSDYTFLETDFINPVIIEVHYGDSFPIRYVSQKLSKHIEYEPNELMTKDFHILIPNFFHREHRKILNDTIFRYEQTSHQKSVYLITKNRHYIPINFAAIFFPSFSNNISLVINVLPIIPPESNSFIFVLNLDAKMICFSKNFENKFFLSHKIFSKLNINFLSLFDINIDKIEEYFSKDIKACTKQGNTGNINDNSFDDERISFINKNKKNKDGSNRKEPKVFFKSKKVLYHNILKIKKTITELELDEEYSKPINLLESKLENFSKCSSNISIRKMNINPNNNKLNIEAKLDEKTENGDYKIKIELKNLGTVPYLLVNLIEENVNTIIPTYEINTDLNSNKSFTNDFTEFKKNDISCKTPNFKGESDDNQRLLEVFYSRNMHQKFSQNKIDYSIKKDANHPSISNNVNSINLTTEAFKKDISNTLLLDTSQNQRSPTLKKDNNNIACTISNRNEGEITSKTVMNLLHYPDGHRTSVVRKTDKELVQVEASKFQTIEKKNVVVIPEEDLSSCQSVDAASVYIYKESSAVKKTFRITKDTIEQKTIKENKNLSILFLLLLIVGASSIYNFFYKFDRIFFISKLFNLYYSNIMAKSCLFFLSNNIINTYILASNFTPKIDDNITIITSDLISKINYLSNELVTKNYNFDKYLMELGNLSDDLYKKLNNSISINFLFTNWQAYSKDSNFHNELYDFHEKSSSFIFENFNENLNFMSFFLGNSRKNVTLNAQLKDVTSFYILNNLMGSLRENANDLSKKVYDILMNGHVTSKYEVIIYQGSFLIIYILLFMAIFYMIINSHGKILDMILIIISLKRNYDHNISVKIHSFKNLITNFCDQKVLEFDRLKQFKVSITSLNFTKLDNAKSLLSSNIEGKKEEVSQKTKLNYDAYKSLPIKVITYAKICLFISFLVFLVLILTNLIVNIQIFDKLILSNVIAVNFFERIPLITELFLYYQYSIISNDTSLVPLLKQNVGGAQTKSMNLYEYLSNGKNEFENINNYYDTSQQNIQTFINEYSYLLENTLNLDKQLQSEDLCFYLSTSIQDNLGLNVIDVNQSLNLLNNISVICKKNGKGVNLKGLNQALLTVQTSLKEKYSEFLNYSNKDMRFLVKLLGDYDHFVNTIEVNFIFENIHLMFANMIYKDLTSFYDYVYYFELTFNIMGLVLNIFLIMYIILGVVRYLQNYYDDLDYSSKKFKKAVITENKLQ